MLPVYFAPLQGFTEAAYRQAHRKFAPGVDGYYTPFLRLEKGEIRGKDLRDLKQDPLGYCLIPQIIVRDVEEFEKLTEGVAALGFREIDINMGCPYPMQTKSGRGSGLLPHPDWVREILKAVDRYSTGSDALKFSIKMRLGLENRDEALALIPYLNDTPLSHITLHPRLGTQQYKGALDFEGFEAFYRDCKHPLVFNGDLTEVHQIRYMEDRYPNLGGIMIGRGLLANPTLSAQYKGIPSDTPLNTLLKIHGEILANYRERLQGDAQILDKLKPFWTYAELPKKTKKKMEKSRKLDEYLAAVAELN